MQVCAVDIASCPSKDIKGAIDDSHGLDNEER